MEPILNNLIKATGWSIFHSLWQGAIIYGILLFITLAFPKLQSRLKHNLAFGAICLIFVCYCLTFFSVFKLPVPLHLEHATSISPSTDNYLFMGSLPLQISNVTERLFPYLVGIYGMGLLFQFFLLSMGYSRMQGLKKAEHFTVPDSWRTSFEQLTLQLNLRRHISFYLSDKINVPLVIGYFKPVVLFPIGLVSQLDIDQVEAILIHELSHIRRNDYLLNLVKTAIETLLFFNPFIWLSGNFINIEREHACDDLVIKFTGNPMTYARALLQLEILKNKATPSFSIAATGKSQHLYQRIKRITDMKTNYMSVRQQMFAITLAIAVVISLAWIKPSKAENTTNTTGKASVETRMEMADFSIQQIPTPPQELPKPTKAPKAPTTPHLPPAPKACSISAPEPPQPPAAPNAISIPVPPAPPKHTRQDTTKRISKKRVIIVDDNDSVKAYKLGADIDSTLNKTLSFLNSPEWKKSMAQISSSAKSIESYFKSKEWKSQQDAIQKNAESIHNYFKSEQWKKQEDNIRRNAETIKKQMNSEEFRQGIEAAKKAIRQQEADEKRP